MSKAFEAMLFAREVHRDQRRRYGGNPYIDHLAEVVGIAMSVVRATPAVHPETVMAVCWLHDCMEDQGISYETLVNRFGVDVADGVRWLSDLETGNRMERKRQSRERLARAPAWIQTIKCADLISNTCTIVLHDPVFAHVFIHEKRLLLDVLTGADARLVQLARAQSTTTDGERAA